MKRPGEASRRPIILTVDDEPSIRSAVCVIFEDGFDVLEAQDGQTALDIVRNRRVDVVLLDLRMPGVSGLTLLEQLLTVNRDVKVILVTAVDNARTAVAAMKIGASDYLTKPFDTAELFGSGRNCGNFVQDALAAGGINPVGPVAGPGSFFELLKAMKEAGVDFSRGVSHVNR